MTFRGRFQNCRACMRRACKGDLADELVRRKCFAGRRAAREDMNKIGWEHLVNEHRRCA